jgi:hypothetical protein
MRYVSTIGYKGCFSGVENRMHRLVVSCILFLVAPGLFAVELPAPGELRKEMGVSGQYVAVVEPHQSNVLHQAHVTYLSVPANEVLDHLFGSEWQSPDNDIVFSATDGYQYAVNAERFKRYKAYLAYARRRAENRTWAVLSHLGQY